jgi:hypothetical protein
MTSPAPRHGGLRVQGVAPLLLWDIFIQRAQALNPGIVDHLKAENLAKPLMRARPAMEGNLDAWAPHFRHSPSRREALTGALTSLRMVWQDPRMRGWNE